MEARLINKINNHNLEFKNNIKSWLNENKVINKKNKNITSDFLKFIFNYEKLILDKNDFKKRKRVKNAIPNCERCNAKRANGEQCTRRKKKNEQFCGTHMKGIPHGIKEDVITNNEFTNIEIWSEDIQGILYYIDKFNNVYDPNDILTDSKNPEIIAKWEKNNLEYKLIEINNE